jgi:hypothetical protein
MCDALGTDFKTHGNVRGTHWEYQLGTQWEQKNPKPKMRDFFQSLKGSHTDPNAISEM